MARPSTIHSLGDRLPDFEAALLRGETASSASKRFGVSVHAVKRYRSGHLARRIQAQVAGLPMPKPSAPTALTPPLKTIDAVSELARLYQQGQSLLAQAETSGQLATAVGALGKLTKVLEVHSKLLGDIPTGSVTNITEITINEVSNQVQQVAMNFNGAPPEVRAWAAKNMLTQKAPVSKKSRGKK